jgi:hypothetical protein
MSFSRHLLTLATCSLVMSFVSAGGSRARVVVGVVETSDGTRLPGVDVRVTNVGGRPTSESGEFTIPLPEQFEPGSEIEFYIAGWKIINLYDGKTWLPKSEAATIHIIVVRMGSAPDDSLRNAHAKNTASSRRLRH